MKKPSLAERVSENLKKAGLISQWHTVNCVEYLVNMQRKYGGELKDHILTYIDAAKHEKCEAEHSGGREAHMKALYD